jgi:tetratricopeptide (TPR) repeat protein
MRCYPFLLVLLSNLLLAGSGLAQTHYQRYGDYKVLPPAYNTFSVVHVDFDTTLRVGAAVAAGQIIGYEQSQPLVRSVRFGLKIIASEEAYDAGQYVEAASLLEEAARAEPDNPFVVYQLARSLYRVGDRERAYPLYTRLMTQLDQVGPAADSVLTVDAWFVDAYWKLATLHLDLGEWPSAIRNMAQFMAATNPQEYERTLLFEELLGYLTESFYHLNDPEMCRFYRAETLRRFPANQYVKQYLLPIKAKPSVKKSTTNKLTKR